jgi:protein-S-isoprenylcysteine O-methyltransferase Ste14
MTASLPFLSGLALALAACLATFFCLRSPLRQVLAEHCGDRARADFWAAVCGVALVLVPFIFALHMRPPAGPGQPFLFLLARQLEWAFIGLVLAVLGLGWVIGRTLPRERPRLHKPPLPVPPPRPRHEEVWRDSWTG